MWNYIILGSLFLFLFFLSLYIHSYFYKKSKTILIRKARTDVTRWASQTKPILGGVTFYFIFLIGCTILFFIVNFKDLLTSLNIVVFIAVTMAFLMGLADDLLSTSIYFKFIVQLMIAFLFIYFGMEIHFFSNHYLNYALTLIWVVGIMNSFNMLDNMDAISTLISIVILSILTMSLFIVHSPFVILPLIILPAVLSFVFFNWNPAKMYMGDNGSQFLGAMFAAIGIYYFWNTNTFDIKFSKIESLLTVGLIFLIPIVDTTTVTINRILRGQSPFKGGKDHTTHFLVYYGFSEKKVAIVFFLIALIGNILAALFLLKIVEFSILWKIISSTFILIVFVFLYGNTRLTKSK